MSDPVGEYLASRSEPVRASLGRVLAIAAERVPDAVPGVSYAMPAMLYRGKGLVAAIENARFLSIYQYSGRVIADLADDLAEFETTSGSIHFAVDHELSDALLVRLVELRRAEIDAGPHKRR